MILADIIKDAISNSKILTTVLGTISKALGLLIDIILLPFLPILTTGIIWLFQGIMAFHRLWQSLDWKETLRIIGDGLKGFVDVLAAGIGGFLKLGLEFISGKLGWDILTWIYNAFMIGTGVVINLAFSAAGRVYEFLKWLWDTIVNFTTNSISINFSVLGTAFEFLKWLWNTITSGGANLVINITESVGKAAAGAASAVGSAASDPLGWLGGVASGGWLSGDSQKSTSSSNTSSTSSQTIVIQGYTDQKLVKTIENLQRTQNRVYGN